MIDMTTASGKALFFVGGLFPVRRTVAGSNPPVPQSSADMQVDRTPPPSPPKRARPASRSPDDDLGLDKGSDCYAKLPEKDELQDNMGIGEDCYARKTSPVEDISADLQEPELVATELSKLVYVDLTTLSNLRAATDRLEQIVEAQQRRIGPVIDGYEMSLARFNANYNGAQILRAVASSPVYAQCSICRDNEMCCWAYGTVKLAGDRCMRKCAAYARLSKMRDAILNYISLAGSGNVRTEDVYADALEYMQSIDKLLSPQPQ